MTQNDYKAMVNEAKQHSYRYYVLSNPTISDAKFDALVDRIAEAEQQHPEWTLADSPTQCVGSDVSNNGRRLVRHRTRMLSCQKAQTHEAVSKWIAQTEKKLKAAEPVQYALEWKMDGISCSLVYQDGVLISAATRGEKGLMGQDLMDHIKYITSVPQKIERNGRVEVRGEIVCPKANLPLLGYKDCRTAASSLCNQVIASKDCALLDFVAWQMDSDEQPATTESLSMTEAEQLGFKCYVKITGTHDVVALLDQYDDEREALPYPVDGVVIKVDYKEAAKSLGATEHHPKGSIAFKFCAQKATTRCTRIEVTTGETGKRTPVAYFEPVEIMGRKVEKASLGSERKAAELGITPGCTIEVGLSNDVTPKVYRVVMPAVEPCIANAEISDDCISNAAEQVEQQPAECSGASAMQQEVISASVMHEEPAPDPKPKRRARAASKSQTSNLRSALPLGSSKKPQIRQLDLFGEPIETSVIEDAGNQSNGHKLLKAAGLLALGVGVMVILMQTGLLIPMGLIGLAAGGFLR